MRLQHPGQVGRPFVQVGVTYVERTVAQPVLDLDPDVVDLVAEFGRVRRDLVVDEPADQAEHHHASEQHDRAAQRLLAELCPQAALERVQYGGEEDAEHEGERDQADPFQHAQQDVTAQGDDEQAARPFRGDPNRPGDRLGGRAGHRDRGHVRLRQHDGGFDVGGSRPRPVSVAAPPEAAASWGRASRGRVALRLPSLIRPRLRLGPRWHARWRRGDRAVPTAAGRRRRSPAASRLIPSPRAARRGWVRRGVVRASRTR